MNKLHLNNMKTWMKINVSYTYIKYTSWCNIRSHIWSIYDMISSKNELSINVWKPHNINLNSHITKSWEFTTLYVAMWIIIIYRDHDSQESNDSNK